MKALPAHARGEWKDPRGAPARRRLLRPDEKIGDLPSGGVEEAQIVEARIASSVRGDRRRSRQERSVERETIGSLSARNHAALVAEAFGGGGIRRREEQSQRDDRLHGAGSSSRFRTNRCRRRATATRQMPSPTIEPTR